MYTGKLTLTNPNRVPFALSNDFRNSMELEFDLEDCTSVKEAQNAVNAQSLFRHWSVMRDTDTRTVFESKDTLGNIHYLIAAKN